MEEYFSRKHHYFAQLVGKWILVKSFSFSKEEMVENCHVKLLMFSPENLLFHNGVYTEIRENKFNVFRKKVVPIVVEISDSGLEMRINYLKLNKIEIFQIMTIEESSLHMLNIEKKLEFYFKRQK